MAEADGDGDQADDDRLGRQAEQELTGPGSEGLEHGVETDPLQGDQGEEQRHHEQHDDEGDRDDPLEGRRLLLDHVEGVDGAGGGHRVETRAVGRGITERRVHDGGDGRPRASPAGSTTRI